MSISALDKLEIPLHHDLGRELDEDVVSIDDDGQVIVFLRWEGIQVALHGSELCKMSFRGIELIDAVPAKQDRDRIAVDG
jgi:hypothetical protein